VGDLCGFTPPRQLTERACCSRTCDAPKNIVSEKKYRCNLRIEKGVFKPKSPRRLILCCPPPLPPAAPSRPQPPPAAAKHPPPPAPPAGREPAAPRRLRLQRRVPLVLAPSLCLSFVRTRRIAGGGIAVHGDLPLSHR
jgi:hypothetical protein